MRRSSLAGWLLLANVTLAAPRVAQAGTPNPIPPAFFSMCAVKGDYPPLSIGTLEHQEFAWGRIEQSKGTFNFQLFDNYMAGAKQNGLVERGHQHRQHGDHALGRRLAMFFKHSILDRGGAGATPDGDVTAHVW